jgi:WD40 repeat protein
MGRTKMKRLLRLSLFVLAPILTAVGVAGCTAEQQQLDATLAHQAAAQLSAIRQEHSQLLVPKTLLLGQQAGTAGVGASDASMSLTGHQGPVRDVSFSPDGRWLATISDDHTARLWDVSTLLPYPARTGDTALTAPVPFVLRGHRDWISAASFSPDGRWLVTASWDGTARLWDVSSLLPGPARTGNTGLSTPDPAAGPFVLGGHQGPLGAATFSSDSHWLATASGDGTARLWDLTTPNPAAEPFGQHSPNRLRPGR